MVINNSAGYQPYLICVSDWLSQSPSDSVVSVSPAAGADGPREGGGGGSGGVCVCGGGEKQILHKSHSSMFLVLCFVFVINW